MASAGAATSLRADADAPAFGFPVACNYGENCFIQNYVDAGPGAAYADHTCGHLSYDGHDGTDIRLLDLSAMRRGIDVVAAAPGVVARKRDGMPDVSYKNVVPDQLAGREAGNAVVIEHGDGWVTQYSHLKQDSVTVASGQQVTRGDKLGEIGLSGRTEFPHLEFSVRKDGTSLDPFTGNAPEQGCGKTGTPLWRAVTARQLAYVPTKLLGAGFAPGRPSVEAARAGDYSSAKLAADSQAIVLWALVMGPRQGDRLRFQITGRDGSILLRDAVEMPKDQARRFAFVGRKRPRTGWPTACYRGVVVLFHDRTVIDRIEKRVGIGRTCS